MTRSFRSTTALAAALALMVPLPLAAETILDAAKAAAMDTAARADQPARAKRLDAELAKGLTEDRLTCAPSGEARPCADDAAMLTPGGLAVHVADNGDIVLAPRKQQQAAGGAGAERKDQDGKGKKPRGKEAAAQDGAESVDAPQVAAAPDAASPKQKKAEAKKERRKTDSEAKDGKKKKAEQPDAMAMAQAAPVVDAPSPDAPETAPLVTAAPTPAADAPPDAVDAPPVTDAPVVADAPVAANPPKAQPSAGGEQPVAQVPSVDAPLVSDAPIRNSQPVAEASGVDAPPVARTAAKPPVVPAPADDKTAGKATTPAGNQAGNQPDAAALAAALAANAQAGAAQSGAPQSGAVDLADVSAAASGQAEAPTAVTIDAAQTAAMEGALAAAAKGRAKAVDAPPAPAKGAGASGKVNGRKKGSGTAVDAPPPGAQALDAPVTISDQATAVVVTEGSARSSSEDFSTRISDKMVRRQQAEFQRLADEAAARAAAGLPAAEPPKAASDGKSGSDDDLAKMLLAGIGGYVVGQLLGQNDRVALNTGDRVVVERPDGTQQVIKNDDALLLQPGAQVTTENFEDGSSRTIVTRDDGSRVVTIRDAQLQVLRRTLIAANGTVTELIDDSAQVDPVVVSDLPPAARPVVVDGPISETALRDALAQESATSRRFTLGQIRNIPEVRALVAPVDINGITFDTGSAAIKPDQAQQLATLGKVLSEYVRNNPREIFLIEGHTDTVGSDAMNLALSDRRAESVALALTEYFRVPPENLVVQGYGEQFLRVAQEGDIRVNRRASVRRITDLLAGH